MNLLERALPLLERLGDYTTWDSSGTGNGPLDPDRPGSLGQRCDLIGDIKRHLADPMTGLWRVEDMLAQVDAEHDDPLATLRDAARRVVDAWEGGDLAGAVSWLASLLPDEPNLPDPCAEIRGPGDPIWMPHYPDMQPTATGEAVCATCGGLRDNPEHGDVSA